MNLTNKRGFTLIELLAVIVILAIIIMVATSNIGGLTQTARKNILAVEGNTAVDGAKEAYQIAILEGDVTTGSACFTIEYLYQEGYYSKGSKDGYQGSVLVSSDDGKVYTYTFWFSDANYVFDGAVSSTVKGKDAYKVSEKGAASETCGGNTSAKMFSK
jgi:type IV pilus assembly protein PilA